MAAALCCASHVGCSKAVINILWEHIFWKRLYAVNAERHFATSAQSQYFFKRRLGVKCLSSFTPQSSYATSYTEDVGRVGGAWMWKSLAQSCLRQIISYFSRVKLYKSIVLD